ncbi:MAG: DUF58 domain-containing protein, partial [Solirubrobacteraceae bacterium]
VAAVVAVLAVWGVVAHDSGAGWVQAIGALVAGALAVGVLAPAFALSRVRCRIVSSPSDASAGALVGLEISASAPVELTPHDPPGPPTLTCGSDRVALEIRPERRGVLRHCTVRVATAAPFGILWWTRTTTLTLPRPLAVSPRLGTDELASACRLARSALDTTRAVPLRDTLARGIRPYELGDRPRLVHWNATAHTGALMVRETERPTSEVTVVDGRLPSTPDEAERHAAQVLATVHALLVNGARVELATLEAGGQIVTPVMSLREAGRRLAFSLPLTGPTDSTR